MVMVFPTRQESGQQLSASHCWTGFKEIRWIFLGTYDKMFRWQHQKRSWLYGRQDLWKLCPGCLMHLQYCWFQCWPGWSILNWSWGKGWHLPKQPSQACSGIGPSQLMRMNEENIKKTSQELRMLSLSLFIQGSLRLFRLLFSIVRNVIIVSKVTSL